MIRVDTGFSALHGKLVVQQPVPMLFALSIFTKAYGAERVTSQGDKLAFSHEKNICN
jgi:hypothetical protein